MTDLVVLNYLQIVLALVFLSTAVQTGILVAYYSDFWYEDIRFWASVATLLSIGIVSAVQVLEHKRSRVPNGVVLLYWLCFLVIYAIKLRSLVSQQAYTSYLAYFVTFCVSTGLAATEFGLEWLVPKKLSEYEIVGKEGECPYEYANIFSVLAFSWM